MSTVVGNVAIVLPVTALISSAPLAETTSACSIPGEDTLASAGHREAPVLGVVVGVERPLRDRNRRVGERVPVDPPDRRRVREPNGGAEDVGAVVLGRARRVDVLALSGRQGVARLVIVLRGTRPQRSRRRSRRTPSRSTQRAPDHPPGARRPRERIRKRPTARYRQRRLRLQRRPRDALRQTPNRRPGGARCSGRARRHDGREHEGMATGRTTRARPRIHRLLIRLRLITNRLTPAYRPDFGGDARPAGCAACYAAARTRSRRARSSASSTDPNVSCAR